MPSLNESFSQFMTSSSLGSAPSDGGLEANHDLSKQTTIDRINSFISNYLNRAWINPYVPLNSLKARLTGNGGLDFDPPVMAFGSMSGSFTVPLKQFGKPSGLLITVSYINVNGFHTLNAHIHGSAVSEDVAITEDEIKEDEYAIKAPAANYTHTQGKKGLPPAHALQGKTITTPAVNLALPPADTSNLPAGALNKR